MSFRRPMNELSKGNFKFIWVGVAAMLATLALDQTAFSQDFKATPVHAMHGAMKRRRLAKRIANASSSTA